MEVALFRLINRASANPLYDAIMPVVTDGGLIEKFIAALLLLLLARALLRRGRDEVRLALRLIVLVVVGVAVGEWLFSGWLRETVARPRPPLGPLAESVRLLVGLGPSASFPSGHAMNSATFGIGLGLAYPRLRTFGLGFAALVGYSRVYVGVHYPLDVLAGWLIGLGLATLLWRGLTAGDRRAGGST